jgi:hypothetical protein
MKSKIIWLRISYWLAAIADFAIAVSILFPERVGLTEFKYPMGLSSAIAFSWGVMLILADRKPIERRWVLIPTILVVALLNFVRIVSSFKGLIEFDLPLTLGGLVILCVLIFSYANSVRLENNK